MGRHYCPISWTAYLSGKWHEVVLAQRKDLNVLHDDELIVVLVEDGAIDNLTQVLLVALCEEQEGFGVAVRSVEQALAVGVLANALEDGAHGAGQLRQTLVLLLLGCFLALAGSLA